MRLRGRVGGAASGVQPAARLGAGKSSGRRSGLSWAAAPERHPPAKPLPSAASAPAGPGRAPSKKLHAPGSQLGAPSRKLHASGSELGAPSKKLRASGSQLGAPSKELRAPASELGAPGKELRASGSQLGAPGKKLRASGADTHAPSTNAGVGQMQNGVAHGSVIASATGMPWGWHPGCIVRCAPRSAIRF